MRSDSQFTVGVHALMLIAFYEHDSITSERVGKSIGCNPVIVRNVFSKLSRAGLLNPGLGRRRTELARPASEITLYDIYSATESGDEPVFKMYEANPKCPVGPDIHRILEPRFCAVRDAMMNELRKTTLAELVSELPPEKNRLPEELRD